MTREAPEFLIDRSLGRHQIPDALRSLGLTVQTLFDVYGNEEQVTPDTAFLREAGEQGWVVLTADGRMRRRADELDVIRAARTRVFYLPRGDLTGAQQVARFENNLDRIIEACAERGPFMYSVGRDGIQRTYPPPGE